MKRLRLYFSDDFSVEADVEDDFINRLNEFEEIGIFSKGKDGFKVKAKKWEVIESKGESS